MFDLKLTRGLGVFAVLAVVVVPLYLFIYVSPSLQDHIINDGQEEANRVANHLAAMFVKADRVSAETLPANLDQRISAVSREFKLAKLKIFSPSGEIVYSTEPAEVGTVNRNSYFHEIVASGRKYSKLVQKEEATLEGQTFKADLVEAYVPVMRGPQFIGAFEVYYDVTAQLADLRQLLHGFYRIILPIVFFALLAIYFTMLRLRGNFSQRLATEQQLREKEARYRNLFERASDAVLICSRDGRIQEVNDRACLLFGHRQESLIGMTLAELLLTEDRGDSAQLVGQIFAEGEAWLPARLVRGDGELLEVEIRGGVISRGKGILQVIIKNVSEQKRREEEVNRGYQTQAILNKLLNLSLENLSLIETLELFIYYVTSFPWLLLEPKGAIFLLGDEPGILELKAYRGLDESLLSSCEQVPFGRCLCGRCAQSGEIVFSDCINDCHDHRYAEVEEHGHYCVPILSVNRELIGVFTLYVKHQAHREQLIEESLEAAASVIAGVIQRKQAEEELQKSRDRLELRVQERTIELEEANLQLGRELSERREAEKALALANQAKDDLIVNLFEIMYEMQANRDHSTFEHALRVAEISRRIGLRMQLAENDMEALRLGCLVHDIGKVAIPDDVLLKPGLFDRMDRQIMQVHTLVGASLFAKHHHDSRIRRIILHHHERLDGSGYPHGLQGGEIGQLERIVAVADVFESLTARRPYKQPFSQRKAIDLLRDEVEEGRLDREIVGILEQVTADWNPLEIVSEFHAEFSKELEVFRQMSYFREPLSDFYNYRYLLFLDDAKMLGNNGKPYHLILANFPSIKEFNQSMGFLKADQILNEIGQKLHQMAGNFDSQFAKEGWTAMLLKKGADFLIYTECGEELVAQLLAEIAVHLDAAQKDWGLDSHCHHHHFASGFPADKALNRVFSVN